MGICLIYSRLLQLKHFGDCQRQVASPSIWCIQNKIYNYIILDFVLNWSSKLQEDNERMCVLSDAYEGLRA